MRNLAYRLQASQISFVYLELSFLLQSFPLELFDCTSPANHVDMSRRWKCKVDSQVSSFLESVDRKFG